jgi:hypothetical protein
MVVNCEYVWQEVSNYLEGEVTPELRIAIETHVRGCLRCTAVVDGMRNVIEIYGDDRMLEVPLGFSQRLHRRLNENLPAPTDRRTFLGWMVAAAAACLVLGSFEIARSSALRRLPLRAAMAHPGTGVPPELAVVLSDDGKLYHLAACSFIHEKNKLRAVTAAEAERAGFTPCPRCLKKYLDTA